MKIIGLSLLVGFMLSLGTGARPSALLDLDWDIEQLTELVGCHQVTFGAVGDDSVGRSEDE